MRRAHDDERGVVMVVVVIVMLLLLALSAVAIGQATQSSTSSVRDTASKAAIQAADAGINIARFRATKAFATPCISATGASVAPQTIGTTSWCPEVTEQLDDQRSYRYRITANTVGDRSVVSSGTTAGVTRRVRATLKRGTVPGVTMGMTALSAVSMTGGSAVFNDGSGSNPGGPYGDVGTNGTLSVSGNAVDQFRNALLGPSGTVTGSVPVSRQSHVAAFSLPLPDFEAPENVNDNAKIAVGTPGWNPATRSIDLSNAVIALDTGVYSFCSIAITGGGLFVKPGAHVQIFLDSPDRTAASANPQSSCGSGAADGTVSVAGNGSLQACAAISGSTCTTGNPADLLITMYGRPSVGYDASVAGGAAKTAVFYAPRSNFYLSGGGKTLGSVAVNTATFAGGSMLWYDDRSRDAGFEPYVRSSWLECRSSAPTADPGSGC